MTVKQYLYMCQLCDGGHDPKSSADSIVLRKDIDIVQLILLNLRDCPQLK